MATPAAVLSILVQAQGIQKTTSQIRQVDRNLDKAGTTTEGLGRKMSGLSTLAKGAFVGGVGAAAIALKGSVRAAEDAQVSQSRMETQLKALGLSYQKHGKHIDEVIQKTSRLSGLDDEDLQGSFTNIVRVTGDVNKALKLNSLAADIARGKHVSLEAASKAVAKAAGGQAGALARLGVNVEKGASGTEALAAAQKKFGGQAEAYGKTAAGAQDRFKVAVENLEEALGKGLLPAVTNVANAVANAVGYFEKHTTQAKLLLGVVGALTLGLGAFSVATKIAAASTAVWSAITTTATAVQTAFNAVLAMNPIGLVIIGLVALGAALVIAYKKSETFRDIVNGAWNAIKATAIAVFDWLKGAVVDLVGFFAARWENIKTAVAAYWSLYKTLIINPIRVAIDWLHTAVGNVVGWLGARWENIKTAASAAWNLIKSYIVTPVRDGIGVVRDVVGRVIGWLGGRWEVLKSNAAAAWNAFKSNIVAPVREAVEAVRGFIGKGKDGLITWLEDKVSDIKKAADALAKPFVGAFHTMRDAVKEVLDFLGKVTGAVKDVVGLIGKIKVPHISIPGIGGVGGGNVGPGGSAPASVDGFNDDAAAFGLSMTSGYRPGDPGWHGQNRARDYSNGWATAGELAFARYMAANFGGKLLELIHTPLGFGIKNGAKVPLGFWGSAVNADHFDHVHVAMEKGGIAPGGWALVGEKGPELAHLPGGTRVYPNDQTNRMLGSSDTPAIHVYIGDRELTDMVDIRIVERDRQSSRTYRAGVQR